jgi:hypothetical protein
MKNREQGRRSTDRLERNRTMSLAMKVMHA